MAESTFFSSSSRVAGGHAPFPSPSNQRPSVALPQASPLRNFRSAAGSDVRAGGFPGSSAFEVCAAAEVISLALAAALSLPRATSPAGGEAPAESSGPPGARGPREWKARPRDAWPLGQAGSGAGGGRSLPGCLSVQALQPGFIRPPSSRELSDFFLRTTRVSGGWDFLCPSHNIPPLACEGRPRSKRRLTWLPTPFPAQTLK